MKKILSMIVIFLIMFNSMNVNASSQNYYFSYVIGENNVGYWSNSDPAMPDSGHYFFYTKNGMVHYVDEIEAIPLILNKGIGLSLRPTVLITFIQNYLENRVVTSPIARVSNGTTFVGITVEDLADLPVIGTTISIPSDEEVTLPSDYVNNVYNYYNEWVENQNFSEPDYISIETRDKDFFSNKFPLDGTFVNAYKNFIANYNYGIAFMIYNSSNLTYTTQWYYVGGDMTKKLLYASNNYNDFCSAHNLTSSENTVNFTDMMLSSHRVALGCQVTDETEVENFSGVWFNANGTYEAPYGNGQQTLEVFNYNNLPCSEFPYLTVYKSMDIVTQMVNQTYAPTVFYSQEYYDFNVNNDNAVTTTVQQIDNSSENNQNIYDNSSESFTEYYTDNDYHIDNSVVINNNTQIFNTYYGDSSGGGDDNGGDNGGGGEIIVPDYDFGYLKVITDILAEFLQGVQNLNEMIIETIHSITLSFGGITTLFESVFGWLPDPILGLMIIGLGLALLGSFITWFR